MPSVTFIKDAPNAFVSSYESFIRMHMNTIAGTDAPSVPVRLQDYDGSRKFSGSVVKKSEIVGLMNKACAAIVKTQKPIAMIPETYLYSGSKNLFEYDNKKALEILRDKYETYVIINPIFE